MCIPASRPTAGVAPPKTFAGLLRIAQTLKSSGTPAYSIGGAEGWTLTDLFENIYLRTFGPVDYGLLSRHKIPWTSPSVTVALQTMVKVLGDTAKANMRIAIMDDDGKNSRPLMLPYARWVGEPDWR